MKATLGTAEQACLLKTNLSTTGWALCVGAGTSSPIFPDWKLLIEMLIASVDKVNAGSIASGLLERYSPDAVLDAAYETLNLTEEKYADALSQLLFSKAKALMTPNEFGLFCRVLSQRGPESIPNKTWEEFISVRDKYLRNTSACQIAEVVSRTIGTESAPQEILSFNAEAMLFALINSFVYQTFATTRTSTAHHPKRALDFVNRSITPFNHDRIRYVFNHGVLAVPGTPKKAATSSSDKLVFREGEYLGLANNSFSWQSSTFMSVGSSRPVVFVGVSLSDQNMRRWLTWIQSNRSSEIVATGGKPKASTRHFWITKKPAEAYMMRWMEACVCHLGVRVIWVDNWNMVGSTLARMLGL